jgi:hypothetical protein
MSHVTKDVSFEDFDPNNVEHLAVWAVYGGGRFKTYASRGPALNGFTSWTKAKLYKGEQGKWIEVAVKDLDAKHNTCDHCHKAHVKESYAHSYSWSWTRAAWNWARVGGMRSKIADPLRLLFLCHGCKQALGL